MTSTWTPPSCTIFVTALRLCRRGEIGSGDCTGRFGITLDVYSHVLPSMDEQAALAVARLILGDDAGPT
jgi:hypothetical protein